MHLPTFTRFVNAGLILATYSYLTIDAFGTAEIQINGAQIERWNIFEITLNGPDSGNPFRDVRLSAEFRHTIAGIALTPEGFYDGGGVYKIRFMPTVEGNWCFITRSNVPELDKLAGEFDCITPDENDHGPVQVRNQFHFAYSDGTPYFPVGTTIYEWAHQEPELQDKTIITLSQAPFNKARMLLPPNRKQERRKTAGDYYPFEKSGEWDWDFTRPNPAFYYNYERCLKSLRELGVEADVILYCPYDMGKEFFGAMGRKNDEYYLRYAIARLAAYRNVWWSLANEYDDLAGKKSEREWHRLFKIVRKYDPYGHLRSIHNHNRHYDYSKPWVTHVSFQTPVTSRGIEELAGLRAKYGKPVIIDEMLYEGDISEVWGSISAEEMVNRFWYCTIGGAYGSHGEVYGDLEDQWSSVGGELRGQSAPRLAFLGKILDAGSPQGIEPLQPWRTWRMRTAGVEGRYYLIYFGYHQPSKLKLPLPKENFYAVEIIDTWNMTVSQVPGNHQYGVEIPLPAKPGLAARIWRVE